MPHPLDLPHVLLNSCTDANYSLNSKLSRLLLPRAAPDTASHELDLELCDNQSRTLHVKGMPRHVHFHL